MALTPNLSKVRVTGSFVDSQGVADTGVVTFQLSTYLIDPVFNQVITNQVITCALVNGQIVDQGHVGVDLVATNDPDLYAGTGTLSSVVWNVTERITGLPSRSYSIKLDYSWQFYDLADLRDLAGNSGVGTGSQGNVGGVGGGGGTTDPGGGGVTNPGTGTIAAHAATHALGGSDPLTASAIGAAPSSEVASRVSGDAALRSDLNAALLRISALESSTPTVSTVPGVPTNVTAVAGDARVTVSFSAPVSNGGSTITGYRVGLSNGSTYTGTSSPIVITGLANDVAIYASVVAINAVGASNASDTVGPIVPTGASSATVPGAPTGISAAPGAGQATVSFVAPVSNGGSSIVSYRVTASTGQTATGTSSPITVVGLTNGTAVTFTVVAINSVGSSPSSVPTQAVTPVTTPTAPTNVSAVATDGQAVVSFTAPSSTGGAPILDYTVTASSGASVVGTSSPVTFAGLMNGVAVSFTVRARNTVGVSPASTVSPTVTPTPGATGTGTPSAPANLTVTVGATSGVATLQWAGPVSIGSSALTGYKLTRIDASGVATAPVTVSSTVSTYSWTGLTVGQTYTLGVQAVNGAGAGAASTVVATIPSPSASSGAEILNTQQSSVETTDLSGFSVNGTGITLSRDSAWSALGTYSLRIASSSGVANSSGVNIERIPVTAGKQYQFTSTLFRTTDKTIAVVFKWRDSNNNALSNGDLTSFDGLSGTTSTISQSGTAPTGAAFLRVTVQYATSAVNSSDAFNLDNSHVTEVAGGPGGGTVTTPGKPEQVSATADANAGSVTVRWAYNTSGTNSDATGFHIGRDGTDSTGYGAFETDIYFTTSEYTFTKLVPGQTYTFSVAATNDAGRGPAYTVTLLMPSPGAASTTYPSDMTYPADDLYPGESGGTSEPSSTTYPGTGTFTGSTTYPGSGSTTPVDPTPTVSVPGAPASVDVSSSSDRKPTVTWVAPSNNGGATISGYSVNWVASDGSSGAAQTVAASLVSYTYMVAFAASAVVTFSVRAINSAGQSSAGTKTFTFPAAAVGVPGQPATVVATSTNTGEVTVTWTPPSSDGGSAVTNYLAGRDGSDATGYGPWTTPAPGLASTIRSQVFTQLVQGRAYTFSVSAVNAVGTGAAKTVTFTVPAPAPTTSATTTPGANSLTVNWTLPANTTGSTVTLNTGTASGTLSATTSSYTFTGLTAGTSYTATVRVTVSGGTVVTTTASGTPTAPSTGTNPLNFKAFTIGANVTGAASGEFNRWIGKKHGQYSTWGGSNESPYWDGGSESKRGRPWGILTASSEYGVNVEATLGKIDVDVAPQFGPHSWVAAGNGTEAGYESFIRTRLVELKNAWGTRTGNLMYRPFHEFNGDWYGWSVKNTADQDGFRLAWIRMRAIWNDVMGGDTRFKLVWSPNRDSKYGLDVRRCWPGKANADIIGVDYYDYAVSKSGTEADWTAEYNRTQNGGGPVGIGAWQSFAKSEGVPIALPEWGEQFGDNLFFLQKMKLFYDANYYSGSGDPSGKVLYCGWHNLYAPGGTVDPNATSGNFLIQQNAADYSGRPTASPFWRNYCQSASYARWLT